MKTFFSTVVILFIMLFGINVYNDYLSNNIEKFISSAEEISFYAKENKWEACNQQVNILLENWRDCETVLCAFTDHGDLDNIKRVINELKDSVCFQEQKDSVMYASVLCILMQRMIENERPSIENILKTNTQMYKIT